MPEFADHSLQALVFDVLRNVVRVPTMSGGFLVLQNIGGSDYFGKPYKCDFSMAYLSHAVRKHKRHIVAHRIEQRQRVLKLVVRLAAKAANKVARQRHVRHQRAYPIDQLQVRFARVTASHALQHRRVARLRGQMDVLANVRMRLHDVQHRVGKVLGMRRRETDANARMAFGHVEQQLVESSAALFRLVDGAKAMH